MQLLRDQNAVPHNANISHVPRRIRAAAARSVHVASLARRTDIRSRALRKASWCLSRRHDRLSSGARGGGGVVVRSLFRMGSESRAGIRAGSRMW